MAPVLRDSAPLPPPWHPFDEAAAAYDDWFDTPLGAFADQVERRAVFELLAPQAGEIILDVGCGTGRYARELARRGARAVGVDPAKGMLAVAQASRSRPGALSYLRATGEALPFRSASFGGVTIVTRRRATGPARRRGRRPRPVSSRDRLRREDCRRRPSRWPR